MVYRILVTLNVPQQRFEMHAFTLTSFEILLMIICLTCDFQFL